jgi:anti-sigma factor (TIGR02949 family)
MRTMRGGKSAGMMCPERDADLQAFFDNELDPSQLARFRDHVAGCPSCQRRLEELEALRAELRSSVAAEAPTRLKAQLQERLGQFERRRRLRWNAVAVILVAGLFSAGAGIYWHLQHHQGSAFMAELARAHEALVSGETPLAYPSADAHLIRRWLGERLSFRPFVPHGALDEYQLEGAQPLSAAGQEGALLLFGKAGRKASLVSLPDPGHIGTAGKKVAMTGHDFWIVGQGAYTLVMWSDQGILYAVVSDDDVQELLEYAYLCVLHMQSPT